MDLLNRKQSNTLQPKLIRACLIVLMSASGCRTTSVVPGPRPVAIVHQPELRSAEINKPAELVDPAPSAEISGQAVNAEDAIDVFRSAGGKLRPDEDGNIVEIDFSFSNVTDQQVRLVTWFPTISEIDLTGTDIHDESLVVLSQLPNLRAVKLKGTQISSVGLKTLAGLSGLILIDASNTDVADGSLENAAEWSNLRYLSLNDTAVTDSGLEYLAPVRGLKGLSLINTAVTADGVETLKRRLPDCVIVAKSTTDSAQTRVFEEEGETLEYSQDLSVSATRGSINQQLQQMLNLAASQPQLAVHLSRVYSEAGQWEETAQILATANVVDPSNEDVNLALGEAYARLGRSNDAILHLEQVVGANEARYVVGMIVYEDTLKSCERYFGDVAAADPEFKAARIRHERIQKELSQMSSHRGTSPTSGADRNVDDSEGPEIIPSAPLRTATRSRMLDADDSH